MFCFSFFILQRNHFEDSKIMMIMMTVHLLSLNLAALTR